MCITNLPVGRLITYKNLPIKVLEELSICDLFAKFSTQNTELTILVKR